MLRGRGPVERPGRVVVGGRRVTCVCRLAPIPPAISIAGRQRHRQLRGDDDQQQQWLESQRWRKRVRRKCFDRTVAPKSESKRTTPCCVARASRRRLDANLPATKFSAERDIVLIVAIVKILAVWTALSVFLGFLIAPALARRLRKYSRKSDDASLASTPRQAVKANAFPLTPRLARCVSRSPSNRKMAAAILEKSRRRGQ